MSDVLLVNMPFSGLRWPSLGISLLKAKLDEEGVTCDVAYWNFDFAESIGLALYEWLNDAFGFVLGGERVFAKSLFAGRLPDDLSYYRQVLCRADPEFSPHDWSEYLSVQEFVDPFLERILTETDWQHYALVGFSTTFQQTLSSLALARQVKQAHPQIQIAFGGANCEGEMGEELLRQFPFVDLVFSGEADATFPQLVRQLLGGRLRALPAGVVARGRRASDSPPQCTSRTDERDSLGPCGASSVIHVLDDLPYPDFTDYFARLASSPLASKIQPLLLFETARGCWWGEKKQCTFCGLNGGTMAFRSKSPQRAVRELRHLCRHYGVHGVCATDNVMDFRYFDTFLPLLQDADLDLRFEYELKTNLTRRQVQALADAGLGAAQLGVETLLTSVLRLMRKGVRAVQNVQTLKWFTEADVEVKWNFLYGFPGEAPEEYAKLPELFETLVHLAPPQAFGPVRIDRFSPYFETPDQFGLTGLVPSPAYGYVFPFAQDALGRLAYYFRSDQTEQGRQPDYVLRVLPSLDEWRIGHPAATLRQSDHLGCTLLLLDSRPCATRFQHRLSGVERELYLFCDTARSLPAMLNFLRKRDTARRVREADIQRTLDRWLADRIMLHLDGRYLSLALRIPPSD